MEFSTEEVRSRTVQKIELAERITATEEFFNRCHGKGGRFCGGKAAVGTYIKEKAETTRETIQERKVSDNIKNVTAGFGKNIGSVRLARLKKADLKTFSNSDLKVVKNQLNIDQKHFKIVQNIGLATAIFNVATGLEPTPFKIARLANSATMIGVATYKNNRIPGELDRVNKELRSRGELSSLDVLTFAAELSVQQEIDKVFKDLKMGKVGKVTKKPTTAELEELKKYIDALEPDPEEGITKKIISDLKEGLKLYK